MALDDNPLEIFDLILERLDASNLKLNTLSARLEAVEKQIAKPAVANVDTVKLATEVNRNLSDYAAAGEKVAARIEAAVSRIPASVSMVSEKVIVVEWRTAYWIAFVAAMVAATAVYFVMVANPAVARYLDDKNVETRAHLDYHIERNPKTELGYYNRR